jgi:hypothetical protein
MDFKTQLTRDNLTFINPTEFGEEVLYNNQPLTIVFQLAESSQKGNGYSHEGRSDLAYAWVSASEITPQRGDLIEREGVVWQVSRILESEQLYKLELLTNESPWG